MLPKLLLPVGLLLVSLLQESLDQVFFSGQWNLPLVPGTNIIGIFTSPFSHSGFGHLLSNSVIFLPLSILVLIRGYKAYILVWISVFISQIFLWSFYSYSIHGLSGVCYALLGYLLCIGFIEKNLTSIFLTAFSFLFFGGSLISLSPLSTASNVSWLGHIMGFISGVFVALLFPTRYLKV